VKPTAVRGLMKRGAAGVIWLEQAAGKMMVQLMKHAKLQELANGIICLEGSVKRTGQ
jgi:hypothetical protein